MERPLIVPFCSSIEIVVDEDWESTQIISALIAEIHACGQDPAKICTVLSDLLRKLEIRDHRITRHLSLLKSPDNQNFAPFNSRLETIVNLIYLSLI